MWILHKTTTHRCLGNTADNSYLLPSPSYETFVQVKLMDVRMENCYCIDGKLVDFHEKKITLEKLYEKFFTSRRSSVLPFLLLNGYKPMRKT